MMPTKRCNMLYQTGITFHKSARKSNEFKSLYFFMPVCVFFQKPVSRMNDTTVAKLPGITWLSVGRAVRRGENKIFYQDRQRHVKPPHTVLVIKNYPKLNMHSERIPPGACHPGLPLAGSGGLASGYSSEKYFSISARVRRTIKYFSTFSRISRAFSFTVPMYLS